MVIFSFLPLSIITFMSFFGIYQANDYHLYKNDDSENTRKIVTEDFSEQMEKTRWCPRTCSESKLIISAISNITMIIGFISMSAKFTNTYTYVGLTIGLWILIAELSIMVVVRYRESNFHFTFSTVFYSTCIAIVLTIWLISFKLTGVNKASTDHDRQLLTALWVMVPVGYCSSIVGVLVAMEVVDCAKSEKEYSMSLYVMLGLLSVMGCGFIGFIVFGLGAVYFGLFLLATFILLGVNIFLIKSKLKIFLDVLGVLFFAIFGAYILTVAKTPVTTMTGVFVFLFGIFLYLGG